MSAISAYEIQHRKNWGKDLSKIGAMKETIEKGFEWSAPTADSLMLGWPVVQETIWGFSSHSADLEGSAFRRSPNILKDKNNFLDYFE